MFKVVLSTKFSSFGGGGAVSDVTIARFWCFSGDMTETAVIDLVGMVQKFGRIDQAFTLWFVRNSLRNLEFLFVFENLTRVATPRRWAAPLT